MSVPEETGYPLRWFKQQDFVRNFYECAICFEVVKDAVQIRDCGHLFCRHCLDGVLRSDEQPECPTCQNRISNEVIVSDIAAMRVIGKLDVNCPNNGCEWDGSLNSLLQEHFGMCPFLLVYCSNADCDEQVTRRDLEAHLAGCEYRIVICPYCHSKHLFKDEVEHLELCLLLPEGCKNGCPQTIPRNQMLEHLEKVCIKTVVTCKYSDFGCNYQCERQELEEHLNQEIRHHLELSTLEIWGLRVKCAQYEKEKEEVKQKCDQNEKDNREIIGKMCAQYEKDKEEVKQKCEQYEEDMEGMKQKCDQYEENIQGLKQKCDQFEKDKEKMKQKCDQFEKDKEKMKQKHEKDIQEMKQKFNTVSHLMIIRDFNKKLLKAKKSSSDGRIDGDPFYSSSYGYKMKLIVHLNETREKYKDHMGVYLSIMKSDHDAILSWPFEKKYTFNLIDQQDDEKERENIVDTVTPGGEDNFKRHLLDESIGWGRPKLVSHETLQTRNYIKDNTVFIKLSIKT